MNYRKLHKLLLYREIYIYVQKIITSSYFIQGFKNDLKLAMDQVDQDYLQEILKSGGDTSEQDLKNDVKVVEDGTTCEEILVSTK